MTGGNKFVLLAGLSGLLFSAHALEIGVSADCLDQGEVVWSQKTLDADRVKVRVKAEPADGYAFAGWTLDTESAKTWPADVRYPGSLTVTVSTNAVIQAAFIPLDEDSLSLDLSLVVPESGRIGETVFWQLDVDSTSYPTVTFSGLPPGVTFDNKTLTLGGRLTTPGLYDIQATAENESGFRFWSRTTIRVANREGTFIFGNDQELPLDEYSHLRFDELFLCEEEIASAEVTGVPSGLTWNADWQLLYGTPDVPGDYALLATATSVSGSVDTASLTLSVVAPDPSDYDFDLDCLLEAQVGDVFESDMAELGSDAHGDEIVAVSGLPSGLTLETRREDGVRYWGLSGTITKAGLYRVWVSVLDDSGETQRVVRTSREVVVSDVPQQYLKVVSADEAKGTVAGDGPATPGLPVTISATPRAGYVFAGWVDEDGERLYLDNGTDYRELKVTLPAGHMYFYTTLVAQFVASAEDVAPDLSALEDVDLDMRADESFSHAFSVGSLSLPQLTFKGLPSGVGCRTVGSSEFVLTYDPETATRRPSPGRYAVTVTAENSSHQKTSTQFLLIVANTRDDRIQVEDDYGELTPGEPMDPILLADAVDFARGETLAVAGLPKGLSYYDKANAKKGIDAHSIVGTPTVPGYYTLTFSAKVVSSVTTNARGRVTYEYEKITATSFLTVLPYPELSISVDEEAAAAGCKVSGAGFYPAGSKVSLTATAGKGWAFAGWEGLDETDWLYLLNPKLSFVSGSDDLWVTASFIPVEEDYLLLSDPTLTENGFAAELPLGEDIADSDFSTLVADLVGTGSRPTISVSGLPSGIRFASDTFLFSGKPKKSGVYHLTVTAKNASGYSQVSLLDVAVLTAEGALPEETALVNAAGIDFSPWAEVTTGVAYGDGARVLAVAPSAETGSAVTKVGVSGLPAGLAATVRLTDAGAANVELKGVPTKPGRQILTVTVRYATGQSCKSQGVMRVRDGGSSYLTLEADSAHGSVSGAGVYSAGQTVKIAAKAVSGFVFAGWTGAASLLDALDGVDLRTPSVSLTFPALDYSEDLILTGHFVPNAEDQTITVTPEAACWTIQPAVTSSFAVAVHSASLPRVTVKGLPKGVQFDLAHGQFTYEPTAATEPGVYSVVLSVQNSTVTRAVTSRFEIDVANRTSSVIGGLDPSKDAYALVAGVTLDPSVIVPEVAEGWSLSVKGLPAGLKYKDGVLTGVPSRTGTFTVHFVATTGKGSSKRTEEATITLEVAAFPSAGAGTYNGFVADEDGTIGTVAATVTSAGRLSVQVALPGKRLSFSAKNWDSVSDGVLAARLKTKTGEQLDLELNPTDVWTDWQLGGTLNVSDTVYSIRAQRSDRAQIAPLVGKYTTTDGWQLKVAASGSVTLTGKYEGKKVSGSGSLCYDENFFGEYVVVLDDNRILLIVYEWIENNFVITTSERHIFE